MDLDPKVVSAAIAKTKESRIEWLVQTLLDEHGEEAVIAALAGSKGDPFVATALLQVCAITGRPITELFGDHEIVEAALAYLLSVEAGTNGLATGRWAWSALFQHFYDGLDRLGNFDDADHFRILLKLIESAPMNDSILFMIGDGPLAHAAGDPDRYATIMRRAKEDPKIARAWWLNVTDGGRLPG